VKLRTQPSEHREAAVHDDRSLVEGRLEGALRQLLRPAEYSDRVPLMLSVCHVPGEPVPVDQASGAVYEPFTTGMVWGKPWSTSWFRIEGRVPEAWAGRHVEVVVGPGFTGDGSGFQAEGLCTTPRASTSKRIHPHNRRLTVAAPARRDEGVRLLLEAAADPAVPHGFGPTSLGDVLTAGDRLIYRFAAADLAVLDEDAPWGWSPTPTCRG